MGLFGAAFFPFFPRLKYGKNVEPAVREIGRKMGRISRLLAAVSLIGLLIVGVASLISR